MSAKTALHNYLSKQLAHNNREPKRKNEKPEKIVERSVLAWCKKHKLDVSVVECKGVYNAKTRTFLHGMTEPGYSDLSGNNQLGMAVYIELKAPGRRSTLRFKQREFLIRKIKAGCFAVVVDSSELLEEIYYQWGNYINKDLFGEAKQYLMGQIPKHRDHVQEGKLFD